MKSHPSRWKKASNGVKVYVCLLETGEEESQEKRYGIQILAPSNGLASLSDNEILEYLVAATEVGKELEVRSWKVFY